MKISLALPTNFDAISIILYAICSIYDPDRIFHGANFQLKICRLQAAINACCMHFVSFSLFLFWFFYLT